MPSGTDLQHLQALTDAKTFPSTAPLAPPAPVAPPATLATPAPDPAAATPSPITARAPSLIPTTNGQQFRVAQLSSMTATDLRDGRTRLTTRFWSPELGKLVTDNVVAPVRPDQILVEYTPNSGVIGVPNIKIAYVNNSLDYLSITREPDKKLFTSRVELRSRFTPQEGGYATLADGSPVFGSEYLGFIDAYDAPNLHNIVKSTEMTRITVENSNDLASHNLTVPTSGPISIGYYAPEFDDRPTELIIDWQDTFESTDTDPDHMYVIGFEDNSKYVRVVMNGNRSYRMYDRNGNDII